MSPTRRLRRLRSLLIVADLLAAAHHLDHQLDRLDRELDRLGDRIDLLEVRHAELDTSPDPARSARV